jgi:uncharacterized protein (TIGR02453 family)
MDNSFDGFKADSFDFFGELAQNNNKAWFDRNRERYERSVAGTFRALLEALEPSLLDLNPNFESAGKTNRNFSRINRDIRFAKDKSPYKLNYYLYVFDARRDRQTDGRLYVGLNADCVTVGMATYASWGKRGMSTLETVFRKRLVSHRQVFRSLLDRIVRRGRYETYWHRVEKGDWVLHSGLPRRDEDWETLQAWIVRKAFPSKVKVLETRDFARRVERIFRELFPLYVFTSSEHPRWQAGLKRLR